MRDERGMTLAEVLGAVVLLGLFVTLFLNLSGFITLSMQRTDDRSAARFVAERQLHTVRELLNRGGTLPADELLDGFQVMYSLESGPDEGAAGDDETILSMQAIVYSGGAARWLTVSVAKEAADEP